MPDVPSAVFVPPSGTPTAPAEVFAPGGGAATAPGGVFTVPSAAATAPSGVFAAPSGSATAPDGVFTAPTGTATAPGGVFTAPSGTATAPGGVYAAPAGAATAPGGIFAPPSGSVTAPGTVFNPVGGAAAAPPPFYGPLEALTQEIVEEVIVDDEGFRGEIGAARAPLALSAAPQSSRLVIMAGLSDVRDATGNPRVLLGGNFELPLTTFGNGYAFFAGSSQNEVLFEGQWNLMLGDVLSFYSLENVAHPRDVSAWIPVGDAGGDLRVFDLAYDRLPDRIVVITGMIDPLDSSISAVTLTSADFFTYSHSQNLYELRFVDTYWQIYDVTNDEVAYSVEWGSNAPWEHDWADSAVNGYSGVPGFAPSLGPVLSAPSAPSHAGALATVVGESEIYEATMTWPAVRWEAQSALHVPRAFPAAFAASLTAWLVNTAAKTVSGAVSFLSSITVNGSATVGSLISSGSATVGSLIAASSARVTGAPAVPATSDSLITAAQAAAVHPTLTQLLGSLIRQWKWINGSTTAASGASASATSQTLGLTTTTTAGSQVYYQFLPWAGGLGGAHARRVRWGDRFRRLSFRVSCETMGLVNATATALICLGKNTGAGAGDLVANGVALRLIGNGAGGAVLWGVCHNGTALSTVNLGVTLGNAHATALIEIVSNGAGTITFLVDGVSRGTLTGGPTTNTSGAEVAMTAEIVGNGNLCLLSVSPVTTLIA